jgi:hypothetical protein
MFSALVYDAPSFTETNPARRPINNEEVNTTIHAIQQNLPCDPLTIFNATSTLIRCIDTTPVYIFTVVARTYSGTTTISAAHWKHVLFLLCTYHFSRKTE